MRSVIFFLSVKPRHKADVAVEHVAVVVVLDLHDLIANREFRAELENGPFCGRVERKLEHFVERAGTGTSTIHRAKDWDVLDGIHAVCLRQACPHQGREDFRHLLVVFNREEVAITFLFLAREDRHSASVDLMVAACRKTSVSRMTGTAFDSIKSERNAPGPTDGN